MTHRHADTPTPKETFASMAQRLRPRLVRMAKRILLDGHAAEDIVQETLARVWAHGSPWPKRLEAYVYRAVRNNALKRRLRERTFVDVGLLEHAACEAESEEQLPPILLERAIEGLPAAQQAVIRMRYYGDMSFREISEALSISINTAASRCRYGLNHLRRALTHAAGPHAPKENRDG